MIHLRHGDCVAVLATFPADSVGGYVCDPPYGLSYGQNTWDTLAGQQAWHRQWVEQAFRTLIPGGVVKAFGGTRTFHRLGAAMEEVGFEDIHLEGWSYGSGMPKSHNIGVYLDKMVRFGKSREILRQGVGNLNGKFSEAGVGFVSQSKGHAITSPEGLLWEGWGTALKPAWEPVLVGRKPVR